MLEFAENIAKQRNFTDLLLSVYEDNIDGIKAYEKSGFKVKNISYSKEIK